MSLFVFFKSVLAFGWIFPLIRGSHQSWFLSFVEKSRKCCVWGWRHRTKKRKKTRRWLPLQKHQPETSRKVRFLVFAKEFVRFGFVAERALQTRSRRYTDAFFLISRYVRVGAKIFKTKCAQCHVAEPGGGHKQVRLRVSFGHKRTGMDEIAVRGTRWTRLGRFEPSDRVFTAPLSLRYSRLEFVVRWSR